jgi:hypothetical protein
MKKTFILLTTVFMAAGAVFAQGWGGRGRPEQVTIEGTLQLHNGQFAVASGNNIYYVPVIGRYAGFIDGLKEGSNASFDGYVLGNFLRPVKMTINGKTYELSSGAKRHDAFGSGPNSFGPRGFAPNGFGHGRHGLHGPGYNWNNRNKSRGGNRGGRG